VNLLTLLSDIFW